MKNKTHYWLSFFLFLYVWSGCSSTQTNSGLSAKESRMSEEFLRCQVLFYKAQAEAELAEMAKILYQYAPFDAPYTPEVQATIETALARLAEDGVSRAIMVDYTSNLERYYLFYDKLKERGGNMEGLEIDFQTPFQEKIYSPPLEGPDAPNHDIKKRAYRKRSYRLLQLFSLTY